MKKQFIPITIAILLGLAFSVDVDAEIEAKRKDLISKTCYIYGDLSIFDLRSLATKANDDYTVTLSGPSIFGTGAKLTFNYC